ncbi:MAG: hypothetical protein ACR2LH_03575 [Thermoleophilaceae bacterium]
MSDVAVGTTDSCAGPAQLLTWRDAVTPLSRSSRRRWTLAYALLLVLGGGLAAFPDTFLSLLGTHARDGDAQFAMLVTLGVVFGMLRRGTRRLTAFDHPRLDERDLATRDRAFRLAYPLLLAVLALSAVALVVVLPDITRTEVLSPGVTSDRPGRFLTIEALLLLVLWGALWAVYLPTGILAWREPDSLSPVAARSPSGLSEPLRDALVALAVGGALILVLLGSDALLALLPLIALLTLLGVLSRRAAG